MSRRLYVARARRIALVARIKLLVCDKPWPSPFRPARERAGTEGIAFLRNKRFVVPVERRENLRFSTTTEAKRAAAVVRGRGAGEGELKWLPFSTNCLAG